MPAIAHMLSRSVGECARTRNVRWIFAGAYGIVWRGIELQNKRRRTRPKRRTKVTAKSFLESDGDVFIVPMSARMAPDMARIHCAALPGSRTAIMGVPYVTAYLTWFQPSLENRIALAAVDSAGHVCGYAVGAPLGYPKALSRHLVWPAARALAVRPWLPLMRAFRHGVLDRFMLLAGRIQAREPAPELPQPTMSLVAIAIARSARRKRIGERLLRAFENTARGLDMRSMRLSMDPDNVIARRFYEACGWQPFSVSADIMYYFRIL
jgi:ribosomal protein S18 acetylase RimI-like enzyme